MRFRLKTDFLTYARDQIRGGIWYKPAWWDAVRKVPPAGFIPRVKKREIPRISFIEDKLSRDFEAKNPVVSQMDRYSSAKGDPRTVAGVFAAEQVKHMRADKTEEEAYALAKTWLLERGPETLARMGVLVSKRAGAELDSQVYAVEMEKQARSLKAALREDLLARQAYRTFMEPEAEYALAMRAFSGEPVFPNTEVDVHEPKERGAADAAAAPIISPQAGGGKPDGV